MRIYSSVVLLSRAISRAVRRVAHSLWHAVADLTGLVTMRFSYEGTVYNPGISDCLLEVHSYTGTCSV